MIAEGNFLIGWRGASHGSGCFMKWIIALVISLWTSIAYAKDDDVVAWKTVGSWSIYVDKTLGNACYAANAYDDGTVMRVGFQDSNSAYALYVAFGNVAWQSVEEGKEYQLTLEIDRSSSWPSPATGIVVANVPFLFINTNQAGFVNELMRKHTIRVKFRGRIVATLSLRGSGAAMRELGACQKIVDETIGRSQRRPEDPFSDAPQVKDKVDPFAL